MTYTEILIYGFFFEKFQCRTKEFIVKIRLSFTREFYLEKIVFIFLALGIVKDEILVSINDIEYDDEVCNYIYFFHFHSLEF